MRSTDHRAREPLTRADLPAELTPETLRGLSFTTLRRLADHRNGVLDAAEQRQFDAALPEVMQSIASRVDEAVRRAPRQGVGPTDPTLRRSYERAQQRLAEQARRIDERFSDLKPPQPDQPAEPPPSPEAPEPLPPAPDDETPNTLEDEVEQTSDTLTMLTKIASLEQQQLEHQEAQLLTETRGVFFAFLVSVSVIVAGVAPLVEAEPHERLLIVLWTIAVTVLAGLVYALVRQVQGRR